MSAEKRQITQASVSASHDPGHGGSYYTYRIDPDGENYKVTVTIRGAHFPPYLPYPRPGGDLYDPPRMEEILVKEKHQVEEFLRKLSEEFGVFELTDLETMVKLHPTRFGFSFHDSSGAKDHTFQYTIDCSHHPDERYKRLVEAFYDFFERERISGKFYEQVRQEEQKWLELKKQAKKRWWKFW